MPKQLAEVTEALANAIVSDLAWLMDQYQQFLDSDIDASANAADNPAALHLRLEPADYLVSSAEFSPSPDLALLLHRFSRIPTKG